MTGAFGGAKADFPPAPTPADRSKFGTGIQRTMRLLSTSTPTKRNKVRILFYGQSITEQKWSASVAEWLRATYPNANLVIENRAIGGHSSQLLWRTAEADLYPFQPDLLVFYVYGSHIDYETIIANTRKRTTAEILIQNEHLTSPADLNESPTPPTTANWSAWMSEVFLPDLSKRFGAELVDQRRSWRTYLNQNKLEPKQLLVDGVHLNDWGCYLMAELVKQHLVYRPELPMAPAEAMVSEIPARWAGNRIKLDFEGSRVDAVCSDYPAFTPATVNLDGKTPDRCVFTRASAFPGSSWPIVLRVTPQAPLIEETWTTKITEASADGKQFKFAVSGSKTGPDGSGSSDKKFISRSGRVAIDPEDWNLAYCEAVFKTAIPEGLETQWKAVPQFVAKFVQPELAGVGLENATTLVQGLPNGKHTLELEIPPGSPRPGILFFRVYRPAYK